MSFAFGSPMTQVEISYKMYDNLPCVTVHSSGSCWSLHNPILALFKRIASSHRHRTTADDGGTGTVLSSPCWGWRSTQSVFAG